MKEKRKNPPPKVGPYQDSSRYHGVFWVEKIGRWLAVTPKPLGKRVVTVIGQFDDEETAAWFRDRVAAHHFPDDGYPLNFPKRQPAPLSLEEARREVRIIWKNERQTSSQYRGVSRLGPNRWQAHISPTNKMVNLGVWRTEIEAARAYDRGARYFEAPAGTLNFPGENLPATAPTVLCHEAQRPARKRKASRFIGVTWWEKRQKWVAKISWRTDGEAGTRTIGYFDVEEDAAQARDKAAKEKDGIFTKLNFHPITGEAVFGLKFTPELLAGTKPRKRFQVRWER